MRLLQRLRDEDDKRAGLRYMGNVFGEPSDEGFGIGPFGLALAHLRRRGIGALVAILARLALGGPFALGQAAEDHQAALAEEGHGVADGAERPQVGGLPVEGILVVL